MEGPVSRVPGSDEVNEGFTMSKNAELSVQEYMQRLATSARSEDVEFARCLQGFIESGDPAWIARVATPPHSEDVQKLGRRVGASYPWGPIDERVAEFAAALYAAHPSRRYPNFHALIDGVMRTVVDREQDGIEAEGRKLLEFVLKPALHMDDLINLIFWTDYSGPFSGWTRDWDRPGRPPGRPSTFETFVLELDQAQLSDAIDVDDGHCQYLLTAVAKERPADAMFWLEQAVSAKGDLGAIEPKRMSALIRGNPVFDAHALLYLKKNQTPEHQAEVLVDLIKLRGIKQHPDLLEYASRPEIAASPDLHELLVESVPEIAVSVLSEILKRKLYQAHPYTAPERYLAGYGAAAHALSSGGAEVFGLLKDADGHGKLVAIKALIDHAPTEAALHTAELCRALLGTVKTVSEREPILAVLAENRPAWFVAEWWEFLADSSKQIRAHAARALFQALGKEAIWPAIERLGSRRAESRLGAVALLGLIEDPKSVAALNNALDNEKSPAVRNAIRVALGTRKATPEDAAPTARFTGFNELEQKLTAQKRPAKAPGSGWLEIAALPALHGTDGTSAGQAVVTQVLAIQAAHKTIEAAPELGAVWAQIDRARSGDFALALLNAWLASPQDAKDRWALTVAGLLGDTRILSVLNGWIPKWCEASRGKLAEYAAQAIALQGSDEALMLLDALATRYRSKQRNIGAAAAQAFQAAASARGLSADELGDVVVPAFGFDADGARDFTWDGGAARAELGTELKLSWSDPESGKTLKGLPPSAPDALKAEVKELGKMLREAAKGQTTRLELALVRQRRWPATRWRELYETHPVLRAYATRLVWGVYGAKGELLRCFRRYPNGLLADAAGGLEELPEAEASIGMVHPLELDAETVAAWRAHLGRFKASPPFPQLDRAVERLDPLHANRRELAVVKDRPVGAGTFRSRAERRGWMRGSVVDAGGVSGYYKTFPGAGVDVSLDIEGLYIGVDPMETVTLGVACFTRAGSVQRGSYTYDDPQAGDERVLPFGAVPPVVYSEAVGDLKAIAGIAAAANDTVEDGEDA